MKLRGWHIAGFGSLVDWRHEELSNELNVFYGPNEAGKSTLLGFLRFALFGFRPGNTKDAKYPPAPGIRHGGSLFLDEGESAGTTLTVERLAAVGRGGKKLRIERASGEAVSEAELTRLLGRADRDLFNNVFAFSLTELQSFDSLTEKGVQDHIFSAGITGAGRSARDALDQIRKEAEQLFKGRAKTRVSILVDEIAKLDESLDAGRERARAYPKLAERESEMKAQRVALRNEIDARRSAGLRARKLGDLWREVQGPMLENMRQLEAIKVSDQFAPDSRDRLDRFVALLERKTEQVAATDQETRALALRLEGLAADRKALAVRDAVLALERDVGLYEQQCKEVTSSEQLVAVSESGLQDAFANLGPGWDEARLRTTHISLSITDEATRYEERLDAARDKVRDFERKLRDGAERFAELKEIREVEASSQQDVDALGRGVGAVDAEDVSSEALDQRAATLRALQANVARRATLEVQLDSACALMSATQRANAGGRSAGANRLRLAALSVAVLGAGTASVLFANNGFQFSTAPFFIVALTTTFFGLIAAIGIRGGKEAPVTSALNIDALEADLATLNEGIDAAAKTLEIETPPSAETIETETVALERLRRDHVERTQTRREIERLDAEIDRVEKTNRTVSKSVAAAEKELEAITSGWQQWAAGVGLPASLVPRNVARFAGEIKTVRASLEARDQAQAEQASLFDAIERWEARVRRVLADAEEEVAPSPRTLRGDPSLITAFTRLVRRVRDADERERQRPEVERAAAEVTERAIKQQAAEGKAREDVDELFARVGARDREDYLAKLVDYERKTSLESKVGDQVAELSRRIGLGDEAVEIRSELEKGRVAVWEAEASAAENEAARLQTESDELVRMHRDVETQIDDLHGSNDVGTLELNRSSLQQELNECIARWRELQVARGLIERTLEQFERERQPAVLQEASHHFATVTGGRYPKIVQSAELGSFNVVDASGQRKTLDALSRGTAEQLYVCIRLGLIAEFCRRAGQLPVAMDDVLVNFDDARALAMANVLADFSKRNSCQVLVFTCSSRTRDLFKQSAPEAFHFELGNNAASS
jgi:uncharacterized protein YhaN